MKSFIFCTSYFKNESEYVSRYLKWINFYKNLEFSKDKPLILIDDGSPDVSFCKDINIIDADLESRDFLGQDLDEVNLVRFPNNLGRLSHLAYFGWWRSFLFSFDIAQKYNYEKIIHVESDCFLLTHKIVDEIEGFEDGWLTYWTDKYLFPETNIQVITSQKFFEKKEIETLLEREKRKSFGFQDSFHAEKVLPFTFVNKKMMGDRYGEEGLKQKPEYNYYCQTPLDMELEFNCQKSDSYE